MKKSLSLLTAAMLLVSLIPALADEPVEAPVEEPVVVEEPVPAEEESAPVEEEPAPAPVEEEPAAAPVVEEPAPAEEETPEAEEEAPVTEEATPVKVEVVAENQPQENAAQTATVSEPVEIEAIDVPVAGADDESNPQEQPEPVEVQPEAADQDVTVSAIRVEGDTWIGGQTVLKAEIQGDASLVEIHWEVSENPEALEPVWNEVAEAGNQTEYRFEMTEQNAKLFWRVTLSNGFESDYIAIRVTEKPVAEKPAEVQRADAPETAEETAQDEGTQTETGKAADEKSVASETKTTDNQTVDTVKTDDADAAEVNTEEKTFVIRTSDDAKKADEKVETTDEDAETADENAADEDAETADEKEKEAVDSDEDAKAVDPEKAESDPDTDTEEEETEDEDAEEDEHIVEATFTCEYEAPYYYEDEITLTATTDLEDAEIIWQINVEGEWVELGQGETLQIALDETNGHHAIRAIAKTEDAEVVSNEIASFDATEFIPDSIQITMTGSEAPVYGDVIHFHADYFTLSSGARVVWESSEDGENWDDMDYEGTDLDLIVSEATDGLMIRAKLLTDDTIID